MKIFKSKKTSNSETKNKESTTNIISRNASSTFEIINTNNQLYPKKIR